MFEQWKFSVLAPKFPVLPQKFPVPLRREFGAKAPEIIGLMGSLMCEAGLNLKNSLFFSLLAGNLGVETGSTMTVSATTHSFERRDFPETAKSPAIGGGRRRRSGGVLSDRRAIDRPLYRRGQTAAGRADRGPFGSGAMVCRDALRPHLPWNKRLPRFDGRINHCYVW